MTLREQALAAMEYAATERIVLEQLAGRSGPLPGNTYFVCALDGLLAFLRDNRSQQVFIHSGGMAVPLRLANVDDLADLLSVDKETPQ